MHAELGQSSEISIGVHDCSRSEFAEFRELYDSRRVTSALED